MWLQAIMETCVEIRICDVCVCVWICVRVCVCVHLCVFTSVYICVCVCVCLHVSARVYVQIIIWQEAVVTSKHNNCRIEMALLNLANESYPNCQIKYIAK